MLKLENISVSFKQHGQRKMALDTISYEFVSGQQYGIIGESGSGKSTLARVIMGLQQVSNGSIAWHNKDYTHFNKHDWRSFRQHVQLIFQDPLDALNPRMTMQELITEPLKNRRLNASDIDQQLNTTLDAVGLPKSSKNRYPHEFSGGQCQRISIARAIILKPTVLICDEPVSALDVSIQAQIINLLQTISTRQSITLLFISHDLSLVRHLCSNLLVLKHGHLLEAGDCESIFKQAQTDYTRKLLQAIPKLDPDEEKYRILTNS